MEFLQLKYFLSAAETENFSKTAEIFSVPSTGISQSVRRLEKELGVELFDRTKNQIKLNKRGEILYNVAKQSMRMLNDVTQTIADDTVGGKIRLLVVTNRELVNRAMIEFKRKYPQVMFYVDYESQKEPAEYDLVITDNIGRRQVDFMNTLIDDELVICLNKEHPLADKDLISLEDLIEEEFVTYSDKYGLNRCLMRISSEIPFWPKITVTVNELGDLIKFVENGLAIALIPKMEGRIYLTDKVVIRPIEKIRNEHNKRKKTMIGYKKNRYMSYATELFLDFLKKKAEEHTKENI